MGTAAEFLGGATLRDDRRCGGVTGMIL